MPELKINLEGDGLLAGVPPDMVVNIETPVTITALDGGMESGRPSVAIIADLPDGRKVFIQTSMIMFVLAANAMRAKYQHQLDSGQVRGVASNKDQTLNLQGT